MGSPRALRAAGPAILVVVALATLIWGLTVGGGAAPFAIGDPGPLVRWGLPTATLAVNLVRGGHGRRARDRPVHAQGRGARVRRGARPRIVSAAVFTVAAASTGFLTFVNTFNPGPRHRARVRRAARPVPRRDRGRPHVAHHRHGRRRDHGARPSRCARGRATLLVAILAIAALVPMATQGHSGEEANHDAAVMALVLHIIAAAVWLGGLLLMVVVRPLISRDAIATAMSRYSSIALAAFVVVAISGTVRAAIAVGAWENLASPYGVILPVKVAALLALGALGAWYRRRLIGGWSGGCGIPSLLGTRRSRARRSWASPAERLPPSPARRRRRRPTCPRCVRPPRSSPAPRCRPS